MDNRPTTSINSNSSIANSSTPTLEQALDKLWDTFKANRWFLPFSQNKKRRRIFQEFKAKLVAHAHISYQSLESSGTAPLSKNTLAKALIEITTLADSRFQQYDSPSFFKLLHDVRLKALKGVDLSTQYERLISSAVETLKTYTLDSIASKKNPIIQPQRQSAIEKIRKNLRIATALGFTETMGSNGQYLDGILTAPKGKRVYMPLWLLTAVYNSLPTKPTEAVAEFFQQHGKIIGITVDDNNYQPPNSQPVLTINPQSNDASSSYTTILSKSPKKSAVPPVWENSFSNTPPTEAKRMLNSLWASDVPEGIVHQFPEITLEATQGNTAKAYTRERLGSYLNKTFLDLITDIKNSSFPTSEQAGLTYLLLRFHHYSPQVVFEIIAPLWQQAKEALSESDKTLELPSLEEAGTRMVLKDFSTRYKGANLNKNGLQATIETNKSKGVSISTGQLLFNKLFLAYGASTSGEQFLPYCKAAMTYFGQLLEANKPEGQHSVLKSTPSSSLRK